MLAIADSHINFTLIRIEISMGKEGERDEHSKGVSKYQT